MSGVPNIERVNISSHVNVALFCISGLMSTGADVSTMEQMCPLRSNDLGQGVPVAVRVVEAQHIIDLSKTDRLELRWDVLAVIDHMGPHPAPGTSFATLPVRPWRRRRVLATRLAIWIAIEPTPPAPPITSSDFPLEAPSREMPIAIEQGFPGGDAGQRQGCSRCEAQNSSACCRRCARPRGGTTLFVPGRRMLPA